MSVLGNFKKFFGLFSKREKRNTLILLLLIVIGGFVETLGIGVILPFTAVVLDQNSVAKYPILKTLSEVPWIGGYRRLVILMCALLILVFILKNLYIFFLIYVQNRFSLNRKLEMKRRLFQSYMYKPYEYFFKKNTAELQRNINSLVAAIMGGMFMTGLSLLTEFVTLAFILTLLLIVDPVATICIILILGGTVFLLYNALKDKIGTAAKKNLLHSRYLFKLVKEGLGNIKSVRVLGREDAFLSRFLFHGKLEVRQIAFYNLTQRVPRLLIETIALSGLVIIVVVNTLSNPDMSAALPLVALFVMAAVRIKPSMNTILSCVTSIRYNSVFFDEIYDDLLEATLAARSGADGRKSVKSLKFEDKIEVKNVTYRYPETEAVILDDVSLSIEKGEMVGVIGSSGAGKTTFVDLLLGLLTPEKGEIQVDGVNINEKNIANWRKNIGYVPQGTFLVDDTIAGNVAFGVPEEKVDREKVWKALEIANLKEFVESLDEKLDTSVGEAGVRFSGGQRQRLGIARALYDDPDVLILDEATSALDTESEKVISDSIAAIGSAKTMIIIAHRLTTLEKCGTVYKVDDGKVTKTELYA